MKGYKRFIFLFIVLLAMYIVAEMNRVEPVNWSVTLSSKDKNPYGAYILYQQLHDIFPRASINSYHLPVYNQLNHFQDSNTAYILVDPELRLSSQDMNALLDYVVDGNYVFIASGNFSGLLMDSLNFAIKSKLDLLNRDSVTINFKNPSLQANKNYGFKRRALEAYLDKYDTLNTVVLGINQHNDVNFIKMPYGEGAFFIHVLPLCFSNYFMLTRSNAEYTAKALSYLPGDIHLLFWDEYYKESDHGSQNPLRFILGNPWLRAAYRIGLLAILLFIGFEIKRRQRVIPVLAPLRNSTLDFVQTVGSVYFNQHDNKNIASKKISHFLESVRSVFFISTNNLNDEFVQALSKKTAIPEKEVNNLVRLIMEIQENNNISDEKLLELNRQIDYFYSMFN
ncbi:MAG: DUF4350 domain-containing protein [Chitinophagaceae bacterium]